MPRRKLRQLDETVLRCLRIEESDAAAGMPDSGDFVEKRYALLLQFRQRVVDVLDLETDVIEPAFAFFYHAGVLAVGRRASDQFDHRLADRIERQPPLRVFLGAPE